MKKIVGIYLLYILSISHPVYANSYMDMITQPPEEQASKDTVPPQNIAPTVKTDNNNLPDIPNTMQPTSKPVVSPSQEQQKYQAFLKAQLKQDNDSFLTKENLQNMLYAIEAGLLGVGLYEIYRYK